MQVWGSFNAGVCLFPSDEVFPRCVATVAAIHSAEWILHHHFISQGCIEEQSGDADMLADGVGLHLSTAPGDAAHQVQTEGIGIALRDGSQIPTFAEERVQLLLGRLPLFDCTWFRVLCIDSPFDVAGDIGSKDASFPLVDEASCRNPAPESFTPYVQANYNDFVGGYVQAIDASMFGLDAPATTIQRRARSTRLM